MSDLKLSDRIMLSAKPIIDRSDTHPFNSKLCLNGLCDGKNGKEIVSRIVKYFRDVKNGFLALFEALDDKAETPEEKQFAKQFVGNMYTFMGRYDVMFKEKFATIDEHIASEKIPESMWSFMQHLYVESVNGSFVDLLVTILGCFSPGYFAIAIKDRHGFVPNPYYEFTVNDIKESETIVLSVKAMIDSKESSVSSEQEEHMKELYKRVLLYDYMHLNDYLDKHSSIKYY